MNRRPLQVWLVGLLTLPLAACGSSAGTIGPTGVDELVVPSPHPQAGDFTRQGTNAWYPLRPGAQWSYRAPIGDSTMLVTVLEQPGRVAGVDTWQVRTDLSEVSGDTTQVTTSTDQIAQDRDGNLWLLGQESGNRTWSVEDADTGAEAGGTPGAGLLWPAEPRVGDGWYTVQLDDAEVTTRITDDELSVTTDAGDFDPVLTVQVKDTQHPWGTDQVAWSRGTGPVQYVLGSSEVLDLVRFTPGT